MKFLTADGQIAEGEPLTETQLMQREELVKFFHREACHDSYHSPYEKKSGVSCEKLASHFVTNFAMTPINGAAFNPAPVEEEETLPLSAPMPVAIPVAVPADETTDDIP